MKLCKWCKGSGRVYMYFHWAATMVQCDKCHGRGFKDLGHATGGYFRRGKDNKS